MKLEDFESFFGFEGTEGFDFILKIGEKEIKISELKDNIDEFLNIELNEYHFDLIFQSDRHGMQRFISYLTTNEVIVFLRNKFDNYRQYNEPLNWIHNLAYMIRLNPQNFKTEHITAIETWLIELEKNYSTDLFNDIKMPNNQMVEIGNPFSSEINFRLFQYLDQWFKPRGNKAKYTYILEHFQNNRERDLMEKPFFEFIENYINEPIAKRKQPSANNTVYFQKLIQLETDFFEAN